MKKSAIIFAAAIAAIISAPSFAAVAIQKDAPVTQNRDMVAAGSSGTAQLAPKALEIAASIMSAQGKMKQMTAECNPSSADVAFVEKMVKEWAKAGGRITLFDRQACGANEKYAVSARDAYYTKTGEPCYDTFADPEMIWNTYPRPGMTSFCKEEGTTGTRCERIYLSDLYDIFAQIDFGPEDYIGSERSSAEKILSKTEQCSNTKLNAKKLEMWKGVLGTTISNLNSKSTNADMLQSIQTIAGSAGSGNILNQILPMTQSVGAILTNR